MAFDWLRKHALRFVARGEQSRALLGVEALLNHIAIVFPDDDADSAVRDLHTALHSLAASLHLEAGRFDEALLSGASALTILARSPRRKDETFLTLLASILFDLAQVHVARGELKQAEREIEKSAKVLERLASVNPQRFGSAHILALDLSASICRTRAGQAEALVRSQEAASKYMEILAVAGDDVAIREATDGLVTTLANQGQTLLRMGRARESVAYLTRALKLLTKLESDLSLRQLEMSIDLAEALISVKTTRDKGIHLLNTLLHKAGKLRAEEHHSRISSLLQNAGSNRLAILSVWYKLFPR